MLDPKITLSRKRCLTPLITRCFQAILSRWGNFGGTDKTGVSKSFFKFVIHFCNTSITTLII